MPRFYVVSPNYDGDCLAAKLQDEGHDVVLKIVDPLYRANLEGMVPHTQSDPRSDDIVIVGSTGLGNEALAWKHAGLAVLGGAPIADRLEHKRWDFMQLCGRLGVATPDTKRFTRYAAAREFLEEDGGRFVFKPSGEQDCADTYVAQGVEDMLAMLTVFERTIPQADFLLQRFADGIEVSLEGWFNGEEWVEGAYNATMEVKKFLPGNCGVATGCAWSTVWAYDGEPSWAVDLHHPFTEVLRKGQYCGAFDLNTVCTKDAIYVLEATPRFGLDAIQNYVALWDMSLGDTLASLALGELEAFRVETNLMAASLRLSIPPYPFATETHHADKHVPIFIEDGDWARVWPSGIRYARDEDRYYASPTDGNLGCLVAHGASLDRAVPKLLDCAKRLQIPNLAYRNDVGDGNGTKWQQLAKWGFPLPPVARRMLKQAPDPKQMQQLAQGARGIGSPFGLQAFRPQ